MLLSQFAQFQRHLETSVSANVSLRPGFLGSNRGTETDFIVRVVCDFAQTVQIDAGIMPHRLPVNPIFGTVYS